jgi:hypothetical protein
MTRHPFIRSLATSIVALSVVLATALPASALSAPNFEVINAGQTRAVELNVSPSGDNDWGDNLLDPYDDILDPDHFVYALRGWNLGSCVQDMRVIYEDGHIDYLYGTNICRLNITLHY